MQMKIAQVSEVQMLASLNHVLAAPIRVFVLAVRLKRKILVSLHNDTEI